MLIAWAYSKEESYPVIQLECLQFEPRTFAEVHEFVVKNRQFYIEVNFGWHCQAVKVDRVVSMLSTAMLTFEWLVWKLCVKTKPWNETAVMLAHQQEVCDQVTYIEISLVIRWRRLWRRCCSGDNWFLALTLMIPALESGVLGAKRRWRSVNNLCDFPEMITKHRNLKGKEASFKIHCISKLLSKFYWTRMTLLLKNSVLADATIDRFACRVRKNMERELKRKQ